MPKTIYAPWKQVNKWHFWKISFGDVVPEVVREQCFSNDDRSVTMWTPDPKHAVEATKKKFYGYGAKKFWDDQYDKNQITIKPGVNPLTDNPPTIDTSEMNISKFKINLEPEEEPEPVKKEPSFKQNQFTFDSKIEKAIDKVLEQDDKK